MNQRFLFPRLDNYYSDYLQLTFVLEEQSKYRGIYVFEEDIFGNVSFQVFALNLSSFPNPEKHFEKFINQFNLVWMHEWLHLVGLTDEGVKKAKRLGFPTT